jgi:hypothetical protein
MIIVIISYNIIVNGHFNSHNININYPIAGPIGIMVI